MMGLLSADILPLMQADFGATCRRFPRNARNTGLMVGQLGKMPRTTPMPTKTKAPRRDARA